MLELFDGRVLVIGMLLWAVQYLMAWENNWLTAMQMRDQFPSDSILPLAWHGGIWFDFPLTFWLAYLVRQHPEWTWWQWLISLVIGFGTSAFMHYIVYAPATLPNTNPMVVVTQEAHVQYGKVTGPVGMPHAIFFGIMFAILINFAIFSQNPSPFELWTTAAIVVVLLFVGNHMVLGLVKEWIILGDYRGDPLHSGIGWATIIGGGAVATVICILRAFLHLW